MIWKKEKKIVSEMWRGVMPKRKANEREREREGEREREKKRERREKWELSLQNERRLREMKKYN